MKISLVKEGGRAYQIRCIEVRDPKPAQIQQITEIDRLTFSEQTFSRYTAGLLLHHGRTFLLQAEDLVIGTCQCLRSWKNPKEAALFCMALRPGWLGQGLGRYFVDQVLQALSTGGIQSVVLEVDPADRRAIHLYEEVFGFKAYDRVEDQYGRGKGKVHLRLELAQELEEPTLEVLHSLTALPPQSGESVGSAQDPRCPPGTGQDGNDATGVSSA